MRASQLFLGKFKKNQDDFKSRRFQNMATSEQQKK